MWRVRIQERDKLKGEHSFEAMVQKSKDKETGIVPQRTAYILRSAPDKGSTHLHGAAADVPFGHRNDKGLCRPAEQDQVQGGEENADDYVLMDNIRTRWNIGIDIENLYPTSSK